MVRGYCSATVRRARSLVLVVAWGLVALMAAAHPRAGVVLCVAADGHVELERGCAPGCAEATAPSHGDAGIGGGSHGACADTLLSRGAAPGSESVSAQPAVTSSVPLPAASSAAATAAPVRRLASHSRRDLLSTVVLLV